MVHNGDCIEVMASMEPNSIDAIVTDPPYFKMKSEAWDRQWDNPRQFLAWLEAVSEHWNRLLKPNGSLYCFASARMAARVEVMIGNRFNVLNQIVWEKSGTGTDNGGGRHSQACKEQLRSFFGNTERIVFAEHYGADNIAKGEAGYEAQCDELRGFVFEPIRAYLAGERDRAGWTTRRVAEEYQKVTKSRTVTGMAAHWFERVQWCLPTLKNYLWLRELFNNAGGEYLRRDYEELRREYEELRRPFAVTKEVPYTDVWRFPTVKPYKGKHPCEKPADLIGHIIKSSTKPGAVVLDCFAGTGSTGVACVSTRRHFVGIELNADYCEIARRRIQQAGDTIATGG